MKKRHYIEAAPGTESLAAIEQLSDRSELSTMYPVAKKEWANKAILSEGERETQRETFRETITSSAPRKFLILGLLIPTPYILLLILLAIGEKTLSLDTLGAKLIPVFFIACAWLGIAYLSLRRTHEALYDHALPMMPIYITSVVCTALATKSIHSAVLALELPNALTTVIATYAGVYLASIGIMAVLLVLWTNPKLPNTGRAWGIVLFIAALTTLAGFTFL